MTHSEPCPFCQILDGAADAEILAESESFVCFLDAYPVTEGHALVVPREHVQYFEALDTNGLFEFLQECLAIVNDRYEPDATNIGLNNGPEAGQTVPHLHWHLIPRYVGDVEDPRGGVRGVIPEKRLY